MKNKKICVYTCITGNYDELKEIDEKLIEKDVDYYCFTNNKSIKSKTWNVVYIEDFSLTNHMLNRKIKMLGYGNLNDDYDILVWMDGNIQIKNKITTFIKEQCNLDKYSFCAFKHPDRDCIYDEAVACVKLKKDSKEIIEKQMDFYEKDKYPHNNGLCEMAVFVRKTKDKKVLDTMKLWYKMINEYSKRDQLSFMWCVRKEKLPLQVIPLTISNNKYFVRTEHYIETNKINKYRLYFGDSKKFEIIRVVDGEYITDGNIYKIENVVVPIDTDIIEFFVCNISGVEFSEFKIISKEKTNSVFYNYTVIDNRDFFFNNSGKIAIYGNFKKDEKISISIKLEITDIEEWIKLAHEYSEKCDNIVNENRLLRENLSEKVQELKTMRCDLENKSQEIFSLKEDLVAITNSKGWIMLEKLRKIKYRKKQ